MFALGLLVPMLALLPMSHASALDASGSAYHPVTYSRIVNTTNGVGGSSSPFASNELRNYTVLGVAGVPSSGVSAVLIDVDVPDATGSNAGIRAFPTGGTAPVDAQLKYSSADVPKSATIAVEPGTGGKITIESGSGSTDVNIDVQGYFSSTGAQGFEPVTPTRLVDTSDGMGIASGEMSSGNTRAVTLDSSVVPTDATAVFANINVTSVSNDGQLSVGSTSSAAASAGPLMNFSAGGPDNMGVTIPISSDGFYLHDGSASGSVNVAIDVEGYFDSDGGGFTPVNGASVYSSGTNGLAARATATIQVGGKNGVPEDAVSGAVLTVTVSDFGDTGGVNLTPVGFAQGQDQLTFNTNNDTLATSTIVVEPGVDGQITLDNHSEDAVTVVVALQGWFAAAPFVPEDQQSGFIQSSLDAGFTQDWADKAIYASSLAEDTLSVCDAGDPSAATVASEDDAPVDDTTGPVGSDSTPTDVASTDGCVATTAPTADVDYYSTDGTLQTEDSYDASSEDFTLGSSADGSTDDIAPRSSVSGSGGTSSASGCIKVTINNVGSSTLHLSTVYIFHTWTSWCWNRSQETVTKVQTGWYISNVSDMLGWDGITNKQLRFFAAADSSHTHSGYLNYRQGSFSECFIWGACMHKYPTNTLRSRWNGTWSWKADS